MQPGLKLMAPQLLSPDAVTHEEKRYFKELGGRIAQLRRDQNLTQQQLADELGVTQQVVASYEIGRRRVPVSVLPVLARTLGTTVEALIGEKAAPAKRGPTPKLQQQMQRLSALPKPKQRAVMEVLEAMLAQASR
jgi:transcriptional regulator with XRE-family HTH domain